MSNLKDQKRPAITSFNTMAPPPPPAPRSKIDRRFELVRAESDRKLEYQRENAKKALAAFAARAPRPVSQN